VKPLVLLLPIPTVSEANTRGGWQGRARRAKNQRGLARLLCQNGLGKAPRPPLTITLTRCAARRLDSDNLAGACKAIRDGIADWLGADDGSPLLTWAYDQRAEPGGRLGVEVRIETRGGATS
jgi:hypothetical protein